MPVLFTRIGIPHPGQQTEALKFAKARKEAVNKLYSLNAEVYVRFGGPVGQIVMVESFESLAEVEKMKTAAIRDSIDNKIPMAPPGVFQTVEEHAWMTV
ncbi:MULTISPECIES: hypothetical protein [Variovorax]|uniref:Antibiotic biosynthesis monooxygenase n=1 Tax=Variovorax ginsengisoli TaxID=363844 RepID=A0ABT8S7A1_9BURK|nr:MULTISPECIES: hypothetical protein [Variovorax]MDM0080027.1 hypothetical protein [Variovorax sp. J31P179]MDN8614687.1 hypothetical protein [Variovorax ginsengisoli]MDO1533857.1 hypothetical protein [Variovorax ginsengisoli]